MAIELKIEDYTAIITIQRPEALNCLNFPSLEQLKKAIDRLSKDTNTRVVIVTGAGERAFCSGADLKERKTMSDEQAQRYIYMIRNTFTALENLPKPVIAAINGIALGGGTELALCCDLRVMSERAYIGLTETSLGIIPGAGGTQRLSRLIGKGRAKEMIFTAKRMGAEEALAIGLVNQVVKEQDVLSASKSLANTIASHAPLAIAQAKFAIDAGMEVDLASGLTIETRAYQSLIPTRDRREGLRAFAEKRKPFFKGE